MSEGPRVALTFDAEHPDRTGCPAGNADRILDVLRSEAARATVFIQGRWAEAYPATAKRIADDGHLIGHHSHYHARMPSLSEDGLVSDVTLAQEAIERITGVDPRPWFRCPFGEGHEDQRVLDGLTALGYRNIHWDIELEDWEPWRTGPAIAADAVSAVQAHDDGAVILLHTWPVGTAEALGPMIAGLRQIGATFITMDQLEGAN